LGGKTITAAQVSFCCYGPTPLVQVVTEVRITLCLKYWIKNPRFFGDKNYEKSNVEEGIFFMPIHLMEGRRWYLSD